MFASATLGYVVLVKHNNTVINSNNMKQQHEVQINKELHCFTLMRWHLTIEESTQNNEHA